MKSDEENLSVDLRKKKMKDKKKPAIAGLLLIQKGW